MGYREQVIADGATFYWRLDETSGTSAASEVGANTGTISGGVTLNQGGVVGGKSMRFDGTSGRIALPNPITFAAAFTVEGWLKTTDVSAGQKTWFSARDGATGGLGGELYLNAGYAALWFDGGSPTQGWTDFNVLIADGRWHHLVVTNDGTTTKMYVDGVLSRTDAQTRSAGSATTSFIGGRPAQPSWYGGNIDDVAIYPTALTAAQIATHYSLGLARTYRDQVLMDGALAYWRLEEPSGSSAASEVNGYTGTIAGGVTLDQPGALSGGKSMLFNGSTGKISMGNVLSITGALSIECWARYAGFGGIRAIVGKLDAAIANGYCVLNHSATGSIQFLAVNGTSLFNFTSGAALTDDRWHHIVCTWDGTTVTNAAKIYVDTKVSLGGAVAGAVIGTTTDPFAIGSFGNLSTGFFAGSVDDVAVYGAALTPAQIANHFNLAVGGQGGAPTEFRSRYRWRDAA